MMARKGVQRGGDGLEALRVSMEPPVFDVIKLSVGRPTERMRSSCGVCVRFCLVVFCLVGGFFWCGLVFFFFFNVFFHLHAHCHQL